MLVKRAISPGLIMLLIFAAAACTGGGSSPPPTVLPPVTASEPTSAPRTPHPTATPEPGLVGVIPLQLQLAPAVPMPRGIVLYALDSAYEGPSPAVRRYYVDADGQMESDQLLVSAGSWSDPAARNIVGVALGAAIGTMAVDICHGGCYGTIDPVTIARTDDGGITWVDVATFPDGALSVIAVERDGVIVRRPAADVPDGGWVLARLGEREEIIPLPPGIPLDAPVAVGVDAGELVLAGLRPGKPRSAISIFPVGQTLGIVPSGVNADNGYLELHTATRAGGLDWAVTWRVGEQSFVGLLSADGPGFRAVLMGSRADGVLDVSITHWLSDTRAIARVQVEMSRVTSDAPRDYWSGVPAIVDIAAGTVEPIAEFVPLSIGKAGGPVPLRVVEGVFYEVAGTGSCLNIREAPTTDASIMICYRDGVLLPGQAAESTGAWLPVVTLDGRPGWASSGYLRFATAP